MILKDDEKFRQDNTDGFSDETLSEMNQKLEIVMNGENRDSSCWYDTLKFESKKILDEY